MKTFFLMLTMLVCSAAASAQTRFVAYGAVENPPYGLVAQLWNGSSTTHVMLDSLIATAVATQICDSSGCHTYTLADGIIEFGIGLSNIEENQCTPITPYVFGGTNAIQAFPNGVRVSMQPCTPNGLPYNAPNPGYPNCGGSGLNYTCTNFIGVMQCWGSFPCTLDLGSQPLDIPPGAGITVWTVRYKNDGGFGYNGMANVNFRYHY